MKLSDPLTYVFLFAMVIVCTAITFIVWAHFDNMAACEKHGGAYLPTISKSGTRAYACFK